MKNKRIIKKNFEFQRIISSKKVIKDQSFVIYFLPSEKGYLEYGISVGKKIGNAVVRNKIKRKVRILINNLLEQYGNKSYQIIVIVRPQFLNRSFQVNQESLQRLIKKMNS
jgi:ribonuclease P protein component